MEHYKVASGELRSGLYPKEQNLDRIFPLNEREINKEERAESAGGERIPNAGTALEQSDYTYIHGLYESVVSST